MMQYKKLQITLHLLRLLTKWNNKMKISGSLPYQTSATSGGTVDSPLTVLL